MTELTADKVRALVPETEAAFQQRVIELARLRGWMVAHFRPARTAKGWRTPMQGDPGFPDLVLARRGRVVFAELKRQGKRPTPEQMAWMREIGLEAHWWWPSDWDQIEKVLA